MEQMKRRGEREGKADKKTEIWLIRFLQETKPNSRGAGERRLRFRCCFGAQLLLLLQGWPVVALGMIDVPWGMPDVPRGRRGGRAWLGWGMKVPITPQTSQVTMPGRAGGQSYGTGLGEHSPAVLPGSSTLGLGDGTRERSVVGGLLRDALGLLPLPAEAGILQIPYPEKAEPSFGLGRRWEGNLLLPHFWWGLFLTKPTSTGNCRGLGKVPQSSQC